MCFFLLIHDSFSLAMAPYLAMSCSEIDMIDPRPTAIHGGFSGSIRTYIEDMDPDMVLLVNNPGGRALE